MTPQEISTIIGEQIKSEKIISWHGINDVNLSEFLIQPNQKIYFIWAEKKLKRVWLVFDELPANVTEGYQVIYDEEHEMFGLATKQNLVTDDKNIGVVIGLYGSFVDTLNNM